MCYFFDTVVHEQQIVQKKMLQVVVGPTYQSISVCLFIATSTLPTRKSLWSLAAFGVIV
eukprot:m.86623 g.86623  ORF g.86623 m.86623 type:complete len:59 (-) comp14475_c1_seq1:146-322(-)